jgi:hypothetical protein
MLPQENKWQLIEHDAHYQITNGSISLCTGEDDADTDESLKPIVDALNNCPFPLHCENVLEFNQHIEIMQLQHEKEQALEREKVLVEALEEIQEQAKRGISPHLPVETMGTKMCIVIDKFITELLASYREKEVENG